MKSKLERPDASRSPQFAFYDGSELGCLLDWREMFNCKDTNEASSSLFDDDDNNSDYRIAIV